VGGLRWSGLSKYLVRRGWEVHVVTAAAQSSHQPSAGIFVHHCPKLKTLNDVYRNWITRRRAGTSGRGASESGSTSTAPVSANGANEDPLRTIDRIRRTLGTAIALPDYARGWVLRAAAKAQSLQNEKEFDVVISSGPPHSAHLAGVIASLGRHSIYVADLRDPWSAIGETVGAQALNNSRWLWATLRSLERVVFARADLVIANTPEFADVLRSTHPELAVSYVSNGIDPERLPAPAPRFDDLTISYLGTLYLGRDLTPVVRAIKEFVSLHPETRRSIKLRVAGYMDAQHEAKFWSEVDAADLRYAVEARPSVPSAEALDLINRSHLTLVLAQNQPSQIPAKLYECVAMRVPTLVIGEQDCAAAREARRIGALACEAHDIAEIRRIIEHVWQHPNKTSAPAVPIGYDDIAAQMDDVLRARLAHVHESALAGAEL
jgi:hypothetical protein